MVTFTRPERKRHIAGNNRFDFLLKPGQKTKIPVRSQDHQCSVCRRWFYTNHEKQKYCSVACWRQYLKARSRRAACPVCRVEFTPRATGRGTLQKCCSRYCAGIHARGPTNPHWHHGRYALPIPTEVAPQPRVSKRHARKKRRLRTPAERGRFTPADIAALMLAREQAQATSPATPPP